MKRDDLPYPWRWCKHYDERNIRCEWCKQKSYPASTQVAEFEGKHYHAACALEVVLELLEDKRHEPH